jgi:hypothetical protein
VGSSFEDPQSRAELLGSAFISLKDIQLLSFIDRGTREPAKDAVRSTSSSHEQVRFN